jgi:hypothetical protein
VSGTCFAPNKLHCWASLDGNFWFGGTTSLIGIANTVTRQTSSRIGGAFSVSLKKHQYLKVSYSDGAYVRFGEQVGYGKLAPSPLR